MKDTDTYQRRKWCQYSHLAPLRRNITFESVPRMKYYLIDTDLSVTPHDGDEQTWMAQWPQQTWDCIDLPKGDLIHCDDEGLYRHEVKLATIADQHLPLPLIVTGSNGERYTSPAHTVEEITAMIAVYTISNNSIS